MNAFAPQAQTGCRPDLRDDPSRKPAMPPRAALGGRTTAAATAQSRAVQMLLSPPWRVLSATKVAQGGGPLALSESYVHGIAQTRAFDPYAISAASQLCRGTQSLMGSLVVVTAGSGRQRTARVACCGLCLRIIARVENLGMPTIYPSGIRRGPLSDTSDCRVSSGMHQPLL